MHHGDPVGINLESNSNGRDLNQRSKLYKTLPLLTNVNPDNFFANLLLGRFSLARRRRNRGGTEAEEGGCAAS